MMKARYILVGFFLLISFLYIAPGKVYAQTAGNPTYCQKQIGGLLGFPTWYKYLNPRIEDPAGAAPPTCAIDFEFTAQKVGAVLMAALEIILRVAALLAIIFVIWGGIQLQLSQGEPDRFANARSTVINALVGLAIAVSATVIVNFVGANLA